MHDGWVDHARPAGSPDATDNHLPGVRVRWFDDATAGQLLAWWSAQLGDAWPPAWLAFAAGRHRACPDGTGRS
jgi:hypothetical protein